MNKSTYILNVSSISPHGVSLEGIGRGLVLRNAGDKSRGQVILEINNNRYMSLILEMISIYLDVGIVEVEHIINNGSYTAFEERVVVHEKIKTDINVEVLKDKNIQAEIKKIFEKIISLRESRKTSDIKKIFKLDNLISTYHRALLLQYNFPEESYLNLFRILDALGNKETAFYFSDAVLRRMSKSFRKKHYDEMLKNGYYKNFHLIISDKIFNNLLRSKRKDKKILNILGMHNKNKIGRLFFVALYSLYQHRNQYLHAGFRFPPKVRKNHTFSKYFGDDHDVNICHPIIKSSKKGSTRIEIKMVGYSDLFEKAIRSRTFRILPKKSRRNLYLMLPAWNFLQEMTKEILLNTLKRIHYLESKN
ncbi:hypothetical protein HZA38_03740 [Candidatus Peregrinibacteria bacterium]|nr:hypothetical protein [Candidatus Peregrinibacteria bacterium]